MISDKCPKCNKSTMRMMVSVFLDVPQSMYCLLSKKNIAKKTVKLDGASWDTARFYCDNSDCNYGLPKI